MYYSAGNYEAFATPQKPANVDGKSAYIVGSGLAALSAACYLVRDAQMKGEHVHVLEKDPIPGGACDGYHYENLGYVMRGGREMDNHFECMWDLFRSIPSIEDENHTVLDEYYWLNKADPNYSLCRARTRSVFPRTFHRDHMQTSSPRLGPGAAGSRGARENANVVTLIQEALCSGDARCVVEAVEKACRLKGLPVPHELYGEMTLESLVAVMAAIGLDLRTERLN